MKNQIRAWRRLRRVGGEAVRTVTNACHHVMDFLPWHSITYSSRRRIFFFTVASKCEHSVTWPFELASDVQIIAVYKMGCNSNGCSSLVFKL